jgi:uncharacterized membrane protein YtjA (UPF0391 family)
VIFLAFCRIKSSRVCAPVRPGARSAPGTFGAQARYLDEAATPHSIEGACPMLGWALTFLVVALIAAVLGFGGIAGVSIEIAKIIFFVAVVLFLISAIIGLVRGRSPTVP